MKYSSEIVQFHQLAGFVKTVKKPVTMSADSIVCLDDEIQELVMVIKTALNFLSSPDKPEMWETTVIRNELLAAINKAEGEL